MTQALAGDLFWFLIVAMILLGVVAGLRAFVARQSARWAVDLPALLDGPDYCQLENCVTPASATVYFAHTRMRVCEGHVELVCEWVGANPAPVYDA